jgi:hypothetical protein
MQLRRLLLIVLAGGAMAMAVRTAAFADSDGAKTLFIWRDDSSTDADPHLETALIFDRPKFTQSPVTVGCGVVQLETGYTYMYDDENGVRVVRHSFPESLLRVGVFADWFELRADWDYDLQRTKTAGAVVRDAGSADLNLGCKLYLTPQDCFLPETGLILGSSVPSGEQPFTAHEVLPNVDYCYDWDLTGTDSWTLMGNTALGETANQLRNDTYARVAQSIAFDHAWSDRIHSFIEFYMFAPINSVADHPQYYFDRGVTVFLMQNVQWDLRVGMGLNSWADDFFAGTGLSVRYW